MLFPYSLFALFIALEQQYQDLRYQCLLQAAALLGNKHHLFFPANYKIANTLLTLDSEGRLTNTNKGRGN